jgi:hypothetical protein
MKEYEVLQSAARYALDHLEQLPGRRVFPSNDSLNKLEQFSIPLSETGFGSQKIFHQISPILCFASSKN